MEIQTNCKKLQLIFIKMTFIFLLINTISCQKGEKVDALEIDPNTEIAKLDWLKQLQTKDPDIKLETRVILDNDHDFSIKYDITDVPYNFEIKEVTLHKNSIKLLHNWADEIIANATTSKPTYNDLYVTLNINNVETGKGVWFSINSDNLKNDSISLTKESLLFTDTKPLSNSRLSPGSKYAFYVPVLGVEAKSEKRSVYWNGVEPLKYNKDTNLNSRLVFSVGKDFNYLIKK